MNPDQRYVIVIPARLESQRLPGKVLIDIAGKSMLQRVWERARKSSAQQVLIATDSEQVKAAAQSFGAQCQLTDPGHRSGSDRIAEVASVNQWGNDQVIVNLQGDEPLMPPACLDQVAAMLGNNPGSDLATLYWPITDPVVAMNPNAVKLVTDKRGRALMFSRSPIPYFRASAQPQSWKRHIGLYAYRASSLISYSAKPQGPLERAEKLEQLRYLEHGGEILTEQACMEIPAGIDTRDDLERVRQHFAS